MSSIKLFNIGQLATYNSEESKMLKKENVEIVIEDGKILKVGTNLNTADIAFDCNNMLVTPGFVDSHTHPIFLNYREDEFCLRLQGKTYEDIANAGGGILKSIKDVRRASKSELIARVKKRMDNFLKLGTTTVECKSGYGLSTASELKSLSVLHEVNNTHEIDIIPTFMGAHAFPSEYKKDKDGYVDLICNEMIPQVEKQGIAKFNDVFCENGYFNIEQTKRILEKGIKHGLHPRMHADEFEDSDAAKLAGQLNVISADHLMAINKEGMKSMVENNVIATLLPGTTFFLGKIKYAPYQKMKNVGLEIALATDFNPGSCNIQSIPFIITLSCIYLKMNILDAIKASTYTAAKSLMVENNTGSIEKGKNADIIVWKIQRVEQIPYFFTGNPIQSVFKNGKSVFTA